MANQQDKHMLGKKTPVICKCGAQAWTNRVVIHEISPPRCAPNPASPFEVTSLISCVACGWLFDTDEYKKIKEEKHAEMQELLSKKTPNSHIAGS